MASISGKPALTDSGVKSRKPGVHADAGPDRVRGLYLRVSEGKARYWFCRLVVDGKRRDMGLGSYPELGLSEARRRAIEARRLRADGIDPIGDRQARRAAVRRQDATAAWTFEKTARAVHETLIPGWRNAKHGDQWINTLAAYAFPAIGRKPVGMIDVADVLEVLKPLWTTKPETARRIRQRMSATMQWAMAHGHAEKDPVAAAVHLLPRQRAKVEHFAAMPYRDVPAFLRRVRELAPSAGTLALEFAILTATRSGEVRGATWTEVDLRKRVWAIPGARMKADREHRVPLSGAALDVLTRSADAFGLGGFLFPSPSKKALSDMTLTACLRRLRVDVTTHGFRSSFRDWAAEQGVSREVAERCLAHVVRSKVEAAVSPNRSA